MNAPNAVFIQKLLQTNEQYQLFDLDNDHLLVAVSGGLDSMVLLKAFHEIKATISVAHVNYQLRGEESDGDAQFVERYCDSHGIPFFKKNINTYELAKTEKIGIQELARKIRYAWFDELVNNHSFDRIVTAHHLNDSLETTLFNLARGGGIRALRGIPYKRDHLIRPLLNFTRSELLAYAKSTNLSWREDSSNTSNNYKRNTIRHELIPAMKQVLPTIETGYLKSKAILTESEHLLQYAVKKALSEHQIGDNQYDITAIKALPFAFTLLFELLNPQGFNEEQIRQILVCQHTGNQWNSKTHVVLWDRESIIVKTREITNKVKNNLIQVNQKEVKTVSFKLAFQTLAKDLELIGSDPHLIFLDYDKLEFPLELRLWQSGDWFCPFGIGGKRKRVKDFLTDKKLNLHQKAEVYVLTSSGKICWVVGHRIDERFKVDQQTQTFYQCQMNRF